MCYEVILAEPTGPKRAPSPPQTSPTQQIAIEDKLKAAEERRLSIEAHKLAALAAKLSKIEEASRKKDELSAAFIAATRESLDAKMNNTEEKREAHIADLKNKLKEHVSKRDEDIPLAMNIFNRRLINLLYLVEKYMLTILIMNSLLNSGHISINSKIIIRQVCLFSNVNVL